MLKLTIQYLHGAGIVTVSQFNNQLDMFKFGKNDRGALPLRIPVNFCRTNMSIPGKASKKWCLFRCLPFLVKCSVSSKDETWQLFFDAREIVEIILSPVIPKNILNHLYFKIVSFLESFSSPFPNKMIPKMHFMLHYPRLISEFGPLQSLWFIASKQSINILNVLLVD